MMGSEQDDAQPNIFGSTDPMENLALDQSPPARGGALGRSSSEGYPSSRGGSSMDEDDPLAVTRPFGNIPQRPAAGQRGGPSVIGGRSRTIAGLTSFSNVDGGSLVEPPSYADAIFTPYLGDGSSPRDVGRGAPGVDGGNAGGSGVSSSNSGLSGSPLANDALHITVTDPQKITSDSNSSIMGSGSYITYLVTTRTRLPGFSREEFSTRRRFRDFVTLGDRLAEAYRGYFVPPRPDKNLMESQVMHNKEFVEMRRVSLEKYMHRLSQHQVIRRSEELRLFLEVDGNLPLAASTDLTSRIVDGASKLPRQLFGAEGSSVPAPAEVSQPATKNSVDLLRMFKELKQTVANDWGSKPAVIEEDKEYLEKKEKLLDLEKHLSESSQQAESLIKAQQELGEVMGELGLSFMKLAKFEEKGQSEAQKSHAADAKRIGTTAVRMSRFSRQANNQTVHHLAQLHEYLALMQACHVAFADRSSALLTVQTLISDLETKRAKIEKLRLSASKVFGGDKSRTRQIGELEKEVTATEAAKLAAQLEYDRVKERNRSEMERFEAERTRDFIGMIEGFVRTQVAYAERSAKIWEEEAEAFPKNLGNRPGEIVGLTGSVVR